jgi:hypothetical protein
MSSRIPDLSATLAARFWCRSMLLIIDTVDGQIVETSPLQSSQNPQNEYPAVYRTRGSDQNRPHEPRLHHCIFPTRHECQAQANAVIKERTAQLRECWTTKTHVTFRESKVLRVIGISTVNQALGTASGWLGLIRTSHATSIAAILAVLLR